MAVNTRHFKAMCTVYMAEIEYKSKVPYREVVDALLWCSLVWRPDLSYAVNQVAKFNSDPGILHWEAVQRILLYAYHKLYLLFSISVSIEVIQLRRREKHRDYRMV